MYAVLTIGQKMLSLLEKTSTLPLWSRLTITALLVAAAFIVQVPRLG